MREAPIVADRGEHIDFLLGKFQHGHAFTEEVVGQIEGRCVPIYRICKRIQNTLRYLVDRPHGDEIEAVCSSFCREEMPFVITQTVLDGVVPGFIGSENMHAAVCAYCPEIVRIRINTNPFRYFFVRTLVG